MKTIKKIFKKIKKTFKFIKKFFIYLINKDSLSDKDRSNMDDIFDSFKYFSIKGIIDRFRFGLVDLKCH